jgi:Tol biopolymer transport system component
VLYASFANWSPGIGGKPTLWKVPIDGGEAVELSRQPASFPRMSPDGKLLGCIHFPGKDPRFSADLIAVLKSDGTRAFTIFQASPSDGTPLSWSPDGKALDYVVNANGLGNIWRQPVSGGPATQVTHFDRDSIFNFSWSQNGSLACARGTTTRTAVLIESFR